MVDAEHRGARLGTMATGAVACAALVTGCSTGTTSSAAPTSAPTSALTSQRSVATPDPAPVVDPPATPTQRAHASGEVRWRTYLGASVPGGSAGPRTVHRGSASGWQHTRAGAILAAAHYTVALDGRQPRALWEAALERATPKRRAKATRHQLARAGRRWDRRRSRDEKAESEKPSDTDEHGLPSSIWRPPVRVVGYSGLVSHTDQKGHRNKNGTKAKKKNKKRDKHEKRAREYAMVLWSRTLGEPTWRRRATTVRWSHGDWRLRLPSGTGWKRARPISDIRPISEVLS